MIPAELRDPVTGARKLLWHGLFEEYDPELFAIFRTWQKAATQTKDLAPKTREFIVIAIDSVVKWPSPFIDDHIHAAFDHGATTQEILEAIGQAEHYGGGEALNHGIAALSKTIRERLAEGASAPRRRGSDEPAKPGNGNLDTYDPEQFALLRSWQEAAMQRDELDEKSRELIAVAVDALVAWPSPFANVHVHAAFEAGATIQEVLDAITTAQGFGHGYNHGLTIMGDVIRERTAAGRPPRRRRA